VRRGASGFVPTVLLGLAGAGLAAVAGAQTWASATTSAPAVRTAAASGADVDPVGLPLTLLALVAWGAVLVMRRRGRRVAAGLGLLAVLGAAASVVPYASTATDVAARRLGDPADATTTTTSWPLALVVGCLLSAAAFVVALRAAGRWPEMSRRYDAPEDGARSVEPSGATDLWRALDEGRDPTA
jgi:uncharacterized membrane protein (TIGR02234 family)